MNRLLHILPILCVVSFGAWLVSTSCSQQPECRKDGDCVKARGPEFLCFELKCRNQNVVLKERPVGPEPKADSGPEPKESGPEAKPEEPTIIKETPPEPVKETHVELPPDAGKLSVGALCDRSLLTGPSERCAPGLTCARFGSFLTYCLQDCSKNSKICAGNSDGRTTCMQVGWTQESKPQPLKVCAKLAKKGESCNPQQSLFCEWKTGSEHLMCLKGKCTQGKLCTSVGCSCGALNKPPSACDITKKLICDHSSNQCVQGIRAYEGEACENLNGIKRFCDIDHFCVTYGGGSIPNICLKLCDLKKPRASCDHHPSKSLKCIPIGGGRGGCIQDNCRKQGDCAFQSYPHICNVKVTPSRTTTCVPLPAPGERKFAETCRPNDSKKGCLHPFLCLASFCTIQCSANREIGNRECQLFHPKSLCILTQTTTGVNHCGFRCDGGCPSGMTCQQGQNFCVGTPP